MPVLILLTTLLRAQSLDHNLPRNYSINLQTPRLSKSPQPFREVSGPRRLRGLHRANELLRELRGPARARQGVLRGGASMLIQSPPALASKSPVLSEAKAESQQENASISGLLGLSRTETRWVPKR